MDWEKFKRFITNSTANSESDHEEKERYSTAPWNNRIYYHIAGWELWKKRPKEKGE